MEQADLNDGVKEYSADSGDAINCIWHAYSCYTEPDPNYVSSSRDPQRSLHCYVVRHQLDYSRLNDKGRAGSSREHHAKLR